MCQCPSWSKEPDLRSGALLSAWVRTPPDTKHINKKTFINLWTLMKF